MRENFPNLKKKVSLSNDIFALVIQGLRATNRYSNKMFRHDLIVL